MIKRKIAILGSTGSIGTQALDVIWQHSELFEVELLTANNNAELLITQAIKYNANTVIIGNSALYKTVSDALAPHYIKVFAGNDSIEDVLLSSQNIDIVLTAMVGFSGLKSTIAAISSGKTIALANKETLVAAGQIVMELARKHNTPIIPVDSEHSAIFQSLQGEHSPLEKIILTASGGPFLNLSQSELETVTREEALNHPKWNMGAKVSIDSATMMNKGLEMIEAKWLFGVESDKIDVIIHPQSIIHSMVQFADSSIIAQMSMPDMRVPIQYALSYPNRLKLDIPRVDFAKMGGFTFSSPNLEKFPCIALAYQALKKGGNMACIMNAANEIGVQLFLEEKIPFLKISKIIEKTMEKCTFVSSPSLEDIFGSDLEGRKYALEIGNKI